MATTLVSEGRKLHGAGNGNGNGRSRNGQDAHDVAADAAHAAEDEALLVLEEIVRLADASKEGRLAERGRATQFNGVHREIVQGVNEMLDALAAPLKVATNYVERIGKGDIPPLITEAYKGDFNGIKDGLNS